MAVNEEQLQTLLQELSQSHQQYSAQLQATMGNLRSLDREFSVLSATEKELQSSTTSGASVWTGVGKMFLQTPVETYSSQLEQQRKEVQERRAALAKKKDYLEVSVQKSEDSLKQILGNVK